MTDTMDAYVLLTNCLCVVLQGYSASSAGELSFQTYSLITDVNIRHGDNLISTAIAGTTLRCGMLCTMDLHCTALGYNRVEKRCELYNNSIPDDTTDLSSDGWNMYIKTDTLCKEALLTNQPYPVRFSTSRVHQDEASKLCQDAGQRLVKIDTKQKMDFIRNIISLCLSYQSVDFWTDGTNINATDFLADGAWTFQDGSSVPMTGDFWCPNKPDNADTEHCLRLWADDGFLFNDKECTDNHGYICEP